VFDNMWSGREAGDQGGPVSSPILPRGALGFEGGGGLGW
jgi:hypothetical protein